MHHLYGKVKSKVEDLWLEEVFGRQGEPDETLGSLLEWVIEGEVWTDLQDASKGIVSRVSSALCCFKSSGKRSKVEEPKISSLADSEAGESKDDTLPEAQTKTTTRTDIFDKSQAPEIAPTTPTLLFDLHALDISDLDPPKSDSTAQRIFSIYLFEPTFDRGNCAKSEKE